MPLNLLNEQMEQQNCMSTDKELQSLKMYFIQFFFLQIVRANAIKYPEENCL